MPTELHAEIAVPFLERGTPVLVEKPMSRTLADADRMIAAAAAGGAVLAVGHTERHNPAVAIALRLVTAPRFIEVHRLSAFPDRSLDIDVVFDLMIHDLDVILAIVGPEVVSIEAVGVPVLTPKYDIANVRLRFASGCIANITASRISKDRVRKIRFFQPDAYLSVDYASQEVEGYRLVRKEPRPDIQGGTIPVERDEPLRRELADFVRAVRERQATAAGGRRRRTRGRWRWRRRSQSEWKLGEGDADVQRSERLHLARWTRNGSLPASPIPVSPDLEISAVTDRVSKSPGGGPGLLFERPDRLRHAGRGEPVRLDEAHLHGARRADARRSRHGDRRAGDAEDSRPACSTP